MVSKTDCWSVNDSSRIFNPYYDIPDPHVRCGSDPNPWTGHDFHSDSTTVLLKSLQALSRIKNFWWFWSKIHPPIKILVFSPECCRFTFPKSHWELLNSMLKFQGSQNFNGIPKMGCQVHRSKNMYTSVSYLSVYIIILTNSVCFIQNFCIEFVMVNV